MVPGLSVMCLTPVCPVFPPQVTGVCGASNSVSTALSLDYLRIVPWYLSTHVLPV